MVVAYDIHAEQAGCWSIEFINEPVTLVKTLDHLQVFNLRFTPEASLRHSTYQEGRREVITRINLCREGHTPR